MQGIPGHSIEYQLGLTIFNYQLPFLPLAVQARGGIESRACELKVSFDGSSEIQNNDEYELKIVHRLEQPYDSGHFSNCFQPGLSLRRS
jgi:hypothetical protein